jgi:hypothetical protein
MKTEVFVTQNAYKHACMYTYICAYIHVCICTAIWLDVKQHLELFDIQNPYIHTYMESSTL